MSRMRLTSEAINLFTKSLIEGHKKGGVGSENLDVEALRDWKANLWVRDTWRKWTSSEKLTPAAVQELQKAAFDGGQVTDDEAVFLLELGLDEGNFEQVKKAGKVELTPDAQAARFDLLRFAVLHLSDADVEKTGTEQAASVAANAQVMHEYLHGTLRAKRSNGHAASAYLAAAQKVAASSRAQAAVSDLPVDSSARDVLKVFLAQTEAIGGWSFLKQGSEHNVLVKPGINWGINGYPTVSSWESVYAATLGTHQKGAAAGAKVKVTVADESGIENKDFGRTTLDNMEDTGILGGAVLAGVENAFVREGKAGDAAHQAALAFMAEKLKAAGVEVPANPTAAEVAPKVRRQHVELLERARQGGVEVVPLDEQPTMILKPVAKGPGEAVAPNEANMTPAQLAAMKHFNDGIRVSTALQDVTDIINLPKPPGRHGIMSNCGLTGAVKNYIGLMAGVDRSESLHSRWARVPPRRDDESMSSYVERNKDFIRRLGPRGVSEAALGQQPPVTANAKDLGDWKAHEADLLQTAGEWVSHMKSEGQKLADERGNEAEGPGQQFFEKLAELNLFFKGKERFVFTDMRETVASFGPDFGEKLAVGKAIASDSAAVVDALASGLLKEAYQRNEGWKYSGRAEFSELEKAPEGVGGLPARLLTRVRDALSSDYKEAQGQHFLRGKNPFVLKNHAAVMSYPGLAPSGMHNVELKLQPDSLASNPYLGPREAPKE